MITTSMSSSTTDYDILLSQKEKMYQNILIRQEKNLKPVIHNNLYIDSPSPHKYLYLRVIAQHCAS